MLHIIATAGSTLDQDVVQPLLASVGLTAWDHAVKMWLLFAVSGLVQLLLSAVICTSLERWRPLTSWPNRHSVAPDIAYAVLVRLAILPLVAYFEYGLLQHLLNSSLAEIGLAAPSLPGLVHSPILAFAIGFVTLDLIDYCQHRLSHRFGWWYGIHSLHHAEEQMTYWSDERAHVLEDAITYFWLIAAGLVIGIPAVQLPFIILLTRLIASVSHANSRLHYSWLGERLLVSPQFHRTHHALHHGGRYIRNMGTALPWWDMLFGTADFTTHTVETGDAAAEPALARGGWFEQQWAGLRRMARLARRRRRYRHATQ